ncbi:MAG TPA: hypothetical protein VI386_38425 [Candidatus Sulfotelmatobacter sp.]
MQLLSSYDSTGRYGAQTPFSDNLGSYWSGGQWEVDSTHNALIAVTNGGNRPTDALLTIHYNNGQQKYEMQQSIAAGDQMWLNVAELIRNQVPDRKGRTLPADLTVGTYELEDLNPGLGGNLIEGKVSLDKTWGHLAYGCIQCCGYSPYLSPDTLGLGVGGNGTIGAYGENNCTGVDGYNLGSYFNQPNAVWWSGNSATAAVTKFNGHGVAAGSTNGFATATIPSGDGNPKVCPQTKQEGDNIINVCPTSTTINSTTQESLSKVFATYKTGIGASVAVQVSPSTPSGVIVTETLSQGTSTCPKGFPNVCITSSGGGITSSLSIGTAGTTLDGTRLDATQNIMWDEHAVASGSSLLASGQSCTATCNQQYTCAGAVIGQYTITYKFQAATMNGSLVTNVIASVQ